ncbi:MAG: PAS domain S-box protein [Gemmatimonadota bacterium]
MALLVRFSTWIGVLAGAFAGRLDRMRAPGPETGPPSAENAEWRRIQLVNRIAAAALRETDMDALLAEAAREVCRLLGVPRCTIRIFGIPDKVAEHFEPRHAAPAGAAPAADDPGAIISVPLGTRDDAVGTLVLEQGARPFSARDVLAAAEATGRQIAVAVRHVRLFHEQREVAGRLWSLMNNVPGLVYRALPDGSISFLGAGAERVTGYPAEDFLGGSVNLRALVHPDDLEGLDGQMEEALRGGLGSVRLTYRIRQRDGSYRWIADRRQLVYDERGRLLHVDGLAIDIAERKRSEANLRLTQFAVDRAGDAAYWTGPDARLIYVNDQACRVLGYARDELLAMTIHDINSSFAPDRWPAHWEELRRRRTFTFESAHRAKDGRVVPVEITVNYIEFDGQEYRCASARDITERLRAQEESRRLQSQLLLARKIEAVGVLAGGIAHDFNNLLAGILGYADLLAHAPDAADDVRKAAAVIRSAAERASQLTAQLLAFARKGKHLNVPVDLKRTIDDAVASFEPALGPGIRVVRRHHEGGAAIMGDPAQIEAALANLALNARDAMPGGGELTVSTEAAVLDDGFCRLHPGASPGRHVLVSVSDTGVGIPRENLGRVFDPFFTTKEQGKGTGLGLSMVFGIVKSHGGYIDVESTVGRGTTFRIYLPAAAGEVLQLEIPYAHPSPEEAGRGKGTILVVDDQDPVRDVCSTMLATLGYRVVTASNGREGLDYYRDHWREIDLVLVDMVMPVLGGPDCFRGMKEVNPGVRAVLATGYSLDGAVQGIMDEGVIGFIRKPFRLDRLSQVVAAALARHA